LKVITSELIDGDHEASLWIGHPAAIALRYRRLLTPTEPHSLVFPTPRKLDLEIALEATEGAAWYADRTQNHQ
jgi:hypothetical protein